MNVIGSIVGSIAGLTSLAYLVTLFVPSWFPFSTAVWSIAEIVSYACVGTYLILLPTLFSRRLRRRTASVYFFGAFAMGWCLWIDAALMLLTAWGRVGLAFGLFTGIFGVVPFAMIACLFGAHWSQLFELLLLAVLIAVGHFGGGWLIAKDAA
jgi:uncharacterized membrane protein YuzA (DUF378 family)